MSIDRLQEQIRAFKNPTMLSLNPTPEVVPAFLVEKAMTQTKDPYAAQAMAYGEFCRDLLDAMAGLIPAVKLQTGCFLMLGAPGIALLQELLPYARDRGYYVVLDSLRGDLPEMAQWMVRGIWGENGGDGAYPCDALTLNGYMGSDSIKPYLPYCRDHEKGIFIVVKTPNRSSVEVQGLITGGRVVHTAMADLVNRWGRDLRGRSGFSQVAAVVGGTYPDVLKSIRDKYEHIFFLVPGYGTQGGSANSVQYAFDRYGHGAVICASRSILGAWKKGESTGEDYVEKAIEAAEKMQKKLAAVVTVM